MKAEELMIGDWVQNPLGAKGWVKNIRLFPKESDGFGGYYVIDIAYSKDGESNARLEEKDIKPIPLTEDFFKDNGYKYDGEAALQGKYVLIFYGDKKHGWEVNVDRDDLEPYGKSVTVHIKYVHEFQHVLRMCGIKKKIVVR